MRQSNVTKSSSFIDGQWVSSDEISDVTKPFSNKVMNNI
jgi:hypothetical protein